MPNTYVGTAASLNGTVITSFNPGDQIEITDENPSTANVTISGNMLHYTLGTGTGSITIDNLGPGRYVVRSLAENNGATGTDITLQQDAHNDFSGDGFSDVLWRNDTGTLTDWLGKSGGGFSQNYTNSVTNVTTDWQVAGTGDFNGDGRVDILWRNINGTIVDWLGNSNGGFARNYTNSVASVPTTWHIVGVGDFNGDGKTDILWRNDTGTLTDWLAQANGGFSSNWVNSSVSVPTNWTVVGTGDFNGDGHDDILWQNTVDGTTADWLGNANGGFTVNYTNSVMSPGTSTHVVGTGDFNGDGLTDVLLRNSSGTISEWLGQTNGGFVVNANVNINVPTSWHVASIGDFNHDSIDDVLWQNSSGTLTDWLGSSTGNGTFTDNWVNASTTVPTSWHIQDPFVHDPFG